MLRKEGVIMRFFIHPTTVLIIILVLLFAHTCGDGEFRPKFISNTSERISFADTNLLSSTILNADRSEKDEPIEIWRPGTRKIVIKLDGMSKKDNSFEIFLGVDHNKNMKLDHKDEMWFGMGWNNKTYDKSILGPKAVSVTFITDKNGILVDHFINGSATIHTNNSEIVFNKDWNIIKLKTEGESSAGKVQIDLFSGSEK